MSSVVVMPFVRGTKVLPKMKAIIMTATEAASNGAQAYKPNARTYAKCGNAKT